EPASGVVDSQDTGMAWARRARSAWRTACTPHRTSQMPTGKATIQSTGAISRLSAAEGALGRAADTLAACGAVRRNRRPKPERSATNKHAIGTMDRWKKWRW